MEKNEILCDACERDLDTPTGHQDYYLVLSSDRRSTFGLDTVFAMGYCRHIDRTKHFCDTNCLEKWVNKDDKNV